MLSTDEKCYECGAPLSFDEVGLHKKLINRGSQKFMCIHCLAKYYNCSVDLLKEKTEQFRQLGCLLFEQPKDE